MINMLISLKIQTYPIINVEILGLSVPKSSYLDLSEKLSINTAVILTLLIGCAAGALIINMCPSALCGYFTDDSGGFYLNIDRKSVV